MEIQKDKDLEQMFNDKLQDILREIRDEKRFLNNRYRHLATCNPTLVWYYQWSVSKSLARVQGLEKQYRKFQYYLKKARGIETKGELNIEQAKQFPIGDLLQEPTSKSPGRSFYKCPLHNERTASFVWYRRNNSYYCFGCNEGSDVIDLYMKLHKVSFKEAVKALT